jgi:hypothetical protein
MRQTSGELLGNFFWKTCKDILKYCALQLTLGLTHLQVVEQYAGENFQGKI